MKEIVCKIIFFILAVFFFFLAQIFLLVQGIKNLKFSKYDDKKIIVEKLLLEQFSQEVYESINTPFSLYSLQEVCSDSDIFPISLNLGTFFDCQGIKTIDLKEECQDKIVKNYTDCSPDSFRDYNFDYDQYLFNPGYRLNHDPRVLYNCYYFSNFTQKLIKLGDKYICKTNTIQSTYERLLYDSEPLTDIYGNPNNCANGKKLCGILDTKNNILCLDNNLPCPNNLFSESVYGNGKYSLYNRSFQTNFNAKKPIITSVIFSENQPMIHEWKLYVKDTYDDLNEEDKIKARSISKKDFELIGKSEDNTYQKLGIQFSVQEISENNIIKNFDSSNFNVNQKLNIYVRNYIGFKNIDELNDFKTIFNEKDQMDNPLYKLSCLKYNPPHIATIVFSSCLLVFEIFYIIFQSISLKSDNHKCYSRLLIAFLIINIIFFVIELVIIAFHFFYYPEIDIDMDERMKKVLELYNERRLSLQIYRIISVVFATASLILNTIKGFGGEEGNREEFV